jgi:hypothetical protein
MEAPGSPSGGATRVSRTFPGRKGGSPAPTVPLRPESAWAAGSDLSGPALRGGSVDPLRLWGELVPEVTVLREDHRDASLLAGLDHLGVALGAAGLDDGGGAGLDRQLGAVGEGEEGVGGEGGAG